MHTTLRKSFSLYINSGEFLFKNIVYPYCNSCQTFIRQVLTHFSTRLHWYSRNTVIQFPKTNFYLKNLHVQHIVCTNKLKWL
ncbi:unnamed protein product [Adineta ricciae]|uniref:Uncharacterized protein n=1 Tax=Adineta ricciae TaxID=249248 RepID=A0A814RP76_ADIRI|nr:unnamed protein product [Adineta ricciae]